MTEANRAGAKQTGFRGYVKDLEELADGHGHRKKSRFYALWDKEYLKGFK